MDDKGKPTGDWWQRVATTLGFKSQQAGLVRLLVIAVVVGILAMTVLDSFGGASGSRRPDGATEVGLPIGVPQDELARMEADIAGQLARTLSTIRGAGRVEVSVTLEAGPSVTAITDTRVDKTQTVEKAGDGSTRDVTTEGTQTTSLISKSGSGDSLVVARKDRAVIAGVVVVAQGARDAKVAEMLHRAAVTHLRVSSNRVMVVPREEDR